MRQGLKTGVMSAIGEMLRKARAVLLRRGVPVDDVEDLVHEAFARITEYERVEQVRSREAMLVTMAVNVAIDHERRRRRAPYSTTTRDLEAIVDAQPGPEEVVSGHARLLRLNEGLKRLSDTSRRIILARRLEDMSVADIAEREGMTTAAVEKQIARATMNLMKWVGE